MASMERPPLIPDQRRQKIMRLLATHEVLSVHQLTELLGVSHMTVRRDIQELERQGRAVSVTGGVRSAKGLNVEPSFDVKQDIDQQEKAAIAAACAPMLRDGACYYLDAGTTTGALVPHLRELGRVTVVTNDFSTLAAMTGDASITVIHVGGVLDHANRSSVGPLAARTLRELAIDIAFISATSWDLAHGVTIPSSEKIEVKRAAMDSAARSVLMSASSKYGLYSLYRVAALSEFDVIATDAGLPEVAAEGIRNLGVELRNADDTAGWSG